MAKYQKYTVYKDSGEWLGEIPFHWDIQPTKRFFRLIAEPAADNNSYELLSVYTEIGVKPRKELEQKGNKASTTDGYWLVKKGDIVVNKLLAWMGAVGYSEYDGVTSPAYDILRSTKKLNPKFYHYLFRTKIANMEFKRWSRGIMEMRLRLYFDELGRISMPFPTFEEQNKIVDFLDHETVQIDTLIAKQEKLIELLKEKRQAVISHAVTKGLNPDVAMKDSGVEWLGKVPEHWVVSKFGYISQVVRGGSPRPAGDPTLFNGDYSPWVTVAEITKDNELYLTSTETFLTKKGSEQCRVFQTGTLLLSNSGATLGVPKILCINANANDGVVGFEELKIDTEYAYFYLSVLTHDLRERVKQGSGQPNLNTDIVKAISITVPPENEIKEIVADIKKKIDHFSKLMASAENAIQLMQERRTALISAAVTGKIDVRNWQNPDKKNEADMELSA
ncbi:restriction endonuclease subunit S [Acinetobacter ursingii]|uniref:Restriction endonuclease subunit S n=1 Tax=Acinetobacter ursingii TaxID=108980 RepID=A0AA46S2S4_9GAMM|nr:restriction endonuclease subunit S [Acinetobacter ursingii]UYF70934.1 restriction endonuclease subunit S [Acinetobacter ursingii]